MTGIQLLNNLGLKSTGLRVWKACVVGPERLITQAWLKRLSSKRQLYFSLWIKFFDEPMLEISGAVTAVVEGQSGDTRWDKFAEDQPDACNVVFRMR